MDKRTSVIILIALFLGLYFSIYFYLTYFVFFNFDMPRVALIVQDFLKSGTFLNSQNYFEESVWKNIPWGPSLVWFYAFFLGMTADPLKVSYLLSAVNLVGILILGRVLWKHLSFRAAAVSVFLLAFNPYWLTYVRIIYQPSPITFFIPISMAVFFEAFFSKKIWALLVLPVTWVILIQIYLPTYSFILTGLIAIPFLLTHKRAILFLGIGSLLAAILLIPTVLFLKANTDYITKYYKAPSLFTPAEKTLPQRIENVALAYIQIPVGGIFEHQTGYGFVNFVQDYFPIYTWTVLVLSGIFGISLIWVLVSGILHKDPKRVLLFFWAITPLWSLNVLWVSDLLPRYFLIAFPAIATVMALFLTDLGHRYKFMFVIPAIIICNFIIFDVAYNAFIKNYYYPTGRFSDVAETPYIFLNQTVKWVITDAKIRSCYPVITNNDKNPEFDLWLETKYIWKYVYGRELTSDTADSNKCYYLISYAQRPQEMGIKDYKKFGLFTASKYKPQ